MWIAPWDLAKSHFLRVGLRHRSGDIESFEAFFPNFPRLSPSDSSSGHGQDGLDRPAEREPVLSFRPNTPGSLAEDSVLVLHSPADQFIFVCEQKSSLSHARCVPPMLHLIHRETRILLAPLFLEHSASPSRLSSARQSWAGQVWIRSLEDFTVVHLTKATPEEALFWHR